MARSRIRSAVAALAAAGALAAALAGVPAGAARGPRTPPPSWPPPPDTARVRFVRELRSRADLGRAPSLLSRVGRGATGARSRDAIALVRPGDVYAPDSALVFVTDGSSGRLVRFDPRARDARAVATEGPGRLGRPTGLGGDGAGRVYVTDPPARRVVVLDRAGRYVRALGGTKDLLNPVDVAVDAARNRVYVVDSHLHQVVVFDTSGALLGRIGRVAGTATDKAAEVATAHDDSIGHAGTSRDVRENRGGGEGEFLYPVGAAVAADGTLYVVDGLNGRVQAFAPDGAFAFQFGRLGDAPGTFARPKGVGVDPDGHVYVLDGAFNNLQVFDPRGALLLAVGTLGRGPGEFWLPLGLHVDAHGYIYAADRYNGRVQVLQYMRLPGDRP